MKKETVKKTTSTKKKATEEQVEEVVETVPWGWAQVCRQLP